MGEGEQDDEQLGEELYKNNKKIVECILLLKQQRSELMYLIQKQRDERKELETEVQRITYKICSINKSIIQREKIKTSYDKTLNELERKYKKLVEDSGALLEDIQKEFDSLDNMNKSTSTTDAPMQEWPEPGDKANTHSKCHCVAGQQPCANEGMPSELSMKTSITLSNK